MIFCFSFIILLLAFELSLASVYEPSRHSRRLYPELRSLLSSEDSSHLSYKDAMSNGIPNSKSKVYKPLRQLKSSALRSSENYHKRQDDAGHMPFHISTEQNASGYYGHKGDNVLLSSVLGMISAAETLRMKHPHSSDGSLPMEDTLKEHLGIDDVQIREDKNWSLPRMGTWDPAQTPVATAVLGSVMLFLILVVVILTIRVHFHNRKKSNSEAWIRHPVVQPPTPASDTVQPKFSTFSQDDEQYLSAEPVRIKAKGLLERRGSNTSLTIDLEASSESVSPSPECLSESFLTSAGNRMNRRQLRTCLKNVRSLHEEFWAIPTNHPERCPVPGSATKNRYRTVLPNEETRVVLKIMDISRPAEAYINANYIRGHSGEGRAFIATQGPLAHTVEDLWSLVLQEKSPAVVMITRLKEKGRPKCEPYIPSYSGRYGLVQVAVKQEIQKNGYTVREISIQKGQEKHTTLHFWFTSWPDHKTPTSAMQLLSMAEEVDGIRKRHKGAVVVHCSAGIGRTGCFIGVTNAMHQIMEEECVDILSIVCQMRLDRGGMVQTAEQYEFIHRAMVLFESTLHLRQHSD